MKVEIEQEELQQLIAYRDHAQKQIDHLQSRGTELLNAHRSRAYGGILSGPEIQAAIKRGDITIDPYVTEHINPASIDLTLGSEYLVYLCDKLDSRTTNKILGQAPGKHGDCIQLLPGELYLMHTAEVISTKCYVPVLDGKSSIGRLGVKVHETAGYGDPGFSGQYTLEVTCVKPTKIYVGMRICQMRFHTLVGEAVDYQASGNYRGELSMGPVPSQAFKQFK